MIKHGVFFQKNSSGFSGICAFFQAGGLYEEKGFRGISHLAEHLNCKGHDAFKREFTIKNFKWNAFTDDTIVGFYFTGLDEYAAQFAKTYVTQCLAYTPTKEEFENEKKIVLQEAVSYLSDGTLDAAFYRALTGYYGAIGDLEDIKNITYEDFIVFFKKYFSKPTTVVFMGGEKMKKAFDSIKGQIDFLKETLPRKQIEMKWNPNSYDVWSKKESQTVIYYTSVPSSVSYASLALFSQLISDGLYSPLYQEIREKNNLCYYIAPNIDRKRKGNLFCVKTETEKDVRFAEIMMDILRLFEKFVSRQYYDDYIKKTVITRKEIKIKAGMELAMKTFFGEDGSFWENFDPKKEEFSYKAMCKIAKTLAKPNNWKKAIHKNDMIILRHPILKGAKA